jgi:hypothetical protein
MLTHQDGNFLRKFTLESGGGIGWRNRVAESGGGIGWRNRVAEQAKASRCAAARARADCGPYSYRAVGDVLGTIEEHDGDCKGRFLVLNDENYRDNILIILLIISN